MGNNNNNQQDHDKSKIIAEYVESISVLDLQMEPFKEQRRELKKNYVENGFLSKDEISLIHKVMRIHKENISIDKLVSMFREVEKTAGVVE